MTGEVHVRSDGTVIVECTPGKVFRAEPLDAPNMGLRWFHDRRPPAEQMRGLGWARKRDAVTALVAAWQEGGGGE